MSNVEECENVNWVNSHVVHNTAFINVRRHHSKTLVIDQGLDSTLAANSLQSRNQEMVLYKYHMNKQSNENNERHDVTITEIIRNANTANMCNGRAVYRDIHLLSFHKCYNNVKREWRDVNEKARNHFEKSRYYHLRISQTPQAPPQ